MYEREQDSYVSRMSYGYKSIAEIFNAYLDSGYPSSFKLLRNVAIAQEFLNVIIYLDKQNALRTYA